MKSLIFVGVALVAALAYYFLVPLSFMHGSGTISAIIYGLLIVIPTYIAISPLFDGAAEDSFLGKYGAVIGLGVGVIAALTTYGSIKESKIDAAITKNGARTFATLKDGEKKTSRSRRGGSSTTCDVTLGYSASGVATDVKTTIPEAEFDKLEGLGQPIPIVYVKDLPDLVMVMLSEPNKSKYANVPLDPQPAAPVEMPAVPTTKE